MVSPLGFPLASYNSDLALEKLITWKHQRTQIKWVHPYTLKCSLQPKDQESVAQQDDQLLDDSHSTPAEQKNKLWPNPHQQRLSGGPRLLPLQTATQHPSTVDRLVSVEVMWAAVTRHPGPPSQERSTKETELPNSQSCPLVTRALVPQVSKEQETWTSTSPDTNGQYTPSPPQSQEAAS